MLLPFTMRLRRLVSTRTDDLNPGDVFGHVYRRNRWGRQHGERFFSGPGSHDPEIVDPYVTAVGAFLDGFSTPPDVVDLGCGDFNVGRRIRDRCGAYIACDVVDALIRHNTRRFASLNVEF